MKLDDLDRLIADLAKESLGGHGADEYCRELMADASATLDHYKTACRLAGAIGLVLDEAQDLCEAPVPTVEMIGVLREKGQRMQKAAREHVAAQKEARLPEVRETPEEMVSRVLTECVFEGDRENRAFYFARAIRQDRLGR